MQTNKLIAPYRENYVHQILIFFVRNSFESTIEDRPVRIQMDRTGPVQKTTVVRFGETAPRAHIRTYQSALLKTIVKPTSSKAKQVG